MAGLVCLVYPFTGGTVPGGEREGYEVKESVVGIVCFFRSFIMMTV